MTQIDLTLTLDAAEFWPEPETCPDWPLARDEFNRAMNAPRSRDDAALRLRDLGRLLNQTDTTRAPTEAERARLKAQYFRAGQVVNWRWDALGLTGTAPASPSVQREAELIVEAVHLRGYLRRLDTAAQIARERAEAGRLSQLRARVDAAPDTLADLERQLVDAEQGEARYRQWEADRLAAARAHELRVQIDGVRAEVAQAARGLDAA